MATTRYGEGNAQLRAEMETQLTKHRYNPAGMDRPPAKIDPSPHLREFKPLDTPIRRAGAKFADGGRAAATAATKGVRTVNSKLPGRLALAGAVVGAAAGLKDSMKDKVGTGSFDQGVKEAASRVTGIERAPSIGERFFGSTLGRTRAKKSPLGVPPSLASK